MRLGKLLALGAAALVTVAGVITVPTASAAITSCPGTGGTFAGGLGTPDSPYLVATRAHLESLSANLSVPAANYMTCSFMQTADISLATGGNWTPIGIDAGGQVFTGSYDGQSHTISGLTINQPTMDGQGLFYNLKDNGGSYSVVKNLKLTNVSVTGRNQVGALSGKADKATISNVSVQGTVTGTGNFVGGLVGESGNLTISDSKASVNVTGIDKVGGMTGEIGGLILRSQVSGTVSGRDTVGGLSGYLSGSYHTNYEVDISQDIAVAVDVTSTSGVSVGGVTGYMSEAGMVFGPRSVAALKNVYYSGSVSSPVTATTGSLVGVTRPWVDNTYPVARLSSIYYLTSGSLPAVGTVGAGTIVDQDVTPKTLQQLKTLATYPAEWLMVASWLPESSRGDAIWGICENANNGLPFVMATQFYPCGGEPPAPAPAPAPEPEPSAEPTVTPTVAPVVIPTTAPVAEPVALPAGEGGALINGVATPVTVAVAPGGKAVVVSAGGVTVEVGGTSPDGTPLPLASDGTLVIAPTGGVQMGGSGFSPNSMVSLYLYSTPTKLGELPVSASGSYSGAALIPAGIEAGSHTIQAIGYTPDGSTLALSVGVTVKSVAAIRGANPVVKASAGAKIAGTRFTVNATGVQARCMVSFWTKGTTVKTKAGAAGRASATLTAPSTKGTWALTAKVTGAGCEQRAAKTMIKVTAEPAGK